MRTIPGIPNPFPSRWSMVLWEGRSNTSTTPWWEGSKKVSTTHTINTCTLPTHTHRTSSYPTTCILFQYIHIRSHKHTHFFVHPLINTHPINPSSLPLPGVCSALGMSDDGSGTVDGRGVIVDAKTTSHANDTAHNTTTANKSQQNP